MIDIISLVRKEGLKNFKSEKVMTILVIFPLFRSLRILASQNNAENTDTQGHLRKK